MYDKKRHKSLIPLIAHFQSELFQHIVLGGN